MNARKLPEPTSTSGWFLRGFTVVYGVAFAISLIVLVLETPVPAVLILALSPLAISFGGMALTRKHLEPTRSHGWFQPGGMFSPKTQSWAFLFGDGIGLPVALGAAGMSSGLTWFSKYHEMWLVVSMVIGIAASTTFRLADANEYKKHGHEDRLNSPTKLWHDGAVYSSLTMLLVYFGVPAVRYDFSGYGWVVVLGVGIWLAMCVVDVFRKPDPINMHPCVQDTKFG